MLPLRLLRAAATFLILATAACSPENAKKKHSSGGDVVTKRWAPGNVASVLGVPSATIQAAITKQLESRPASIAEDKWRHAKVLYKVYGNRPLWLDAEGVHDSRAMALLKALVDAHTDALGIDAYPLGDLTRAIAATNQKHPTAEQLAQADVLLTAAFSALGEDLLVGQVDPKSLGGQDWHISGTEDRIDSALVRSMGSEPLDKAIATMRPQDEQYDALRKELVRWRAVAAKGWPTIPSGRAVKPGESDSPQRIAAVRARLAAEGLLSDSGATPQPDAPAAPAADAKAQRAASKDAKSRQAPARSGAVYDRALAGAVARFQAQHGINVDSMLGEETVASMNVPAQTRLAQIAANLERFRWMPRSLGSRYILVNVPAFRLEAYDSGEKSLEMKVIVGQEYEDKKTPVFADSMEFVVFRPYWEVTDDIANKELFPKLNSDPGFAERGGYEVVTQEGRPHIRQKPGPENSLGLVKFLFPNSFNIYLHDTPSKQLFEKDVRAFSHGCIRLEKPAELAQWVLGWDAAKVQDQMNGSDNHRVTLPKKIPVYIAYFTTYVKDGRLYFGNDLYNRDDGLVQKVGSAAYPSPTALRTVQELGKLVRS